MCTIWGVFAVMFSVYNAVDDVQVAPVPDVNCTCPVVVAALNDRVIEQMIGVSPATPVIIDVLVVLAGMLLGPVVPSQAMGATGPIVLNAAGVGAIGPPMPV